MDGKIAFFQNYNLIPVKKIKFGTAEPDGEIIYLTAG